MWRLFSKFQFACLTVSRIDCGTSRPRKPWHGIGYAIGYVCVHACVRVINGSSDFESLFFHVMQNKTKCDSMCWLMLEAFSTVIIFLCLRKSANNVHSKKSYQVKIFSFSRSFQKMIMQLDCWIELIVVLIFIVKLIMNQK